jgi:peptidoglycan/LPS O-acetylase OafA/YrhL
VVSTPAQPVTGLIADLRLPHRHFNVLDLSRLLAAVAVLFWHYQHFYVAPGWENFHVNRAREPLYRWLAFLYDHGADAVQYFWAVSGFVFAHVYLADPRARGRFWLARVARLWPLHLLTLGLVAAMQAVALARWGEFYIYDWNDARHFVLSLFLAQYWGFQANQSFNGPSWSLSTEIVAYAAFWLLLPALRRAGLLVTVVVAGAIAAMLWRGAPDKDVLACVFYFFTGVGFYVAMLRGLVTPRALIPLAVVLVAMAVAVNVAGGAGFAVRLFAIFALLALAVGIDHLDPHGRLRFGKSLGDASYGIYLWHFPIQLALVLVLPNIRAMAHQPSFLVFFIGTACLAGLASHRWIERPAQRWVMRQGGRWRTAAGGATGAA